MEIKALEAKLFDGFLRKPYNFNEVKKLIEKFSNRNI
jgi:hypothetical protein